MAASSTTKEDIYEATLTVIVQEGVRGATWRRVAKQAGLSPGTLTYHFTHTESLLLGAFTWMIDNISRSFFERMSMASSKASACEAVVDLICGDIWASKRHLVLSFELYSLAARKNDFRLLLQEWMARSRKSLCLVFPYATACALDALIEGFTIHNLLNDAPLNREIILDAVTKVAASQGDKNEK